MTLSSLATTILTRLDALAKKSKAADEYQRNPEMRYALEHLGLQSLSNILARKLDGPNPKQRSDADIAREKSFRMLNDREIDAYSFETTLREGFIHSQIPSLPFESLDAYPRMRFFESIFPRAEVGVDSLRLSPLQQVHKNYMKKVYDGGMSWDELTYLTNQHKELKHLSNGFNLTNRLATFVRNEAATDFLKEAYSAAAAVALPMDALALRAARWTDPKASGEGHERDAWRLRHFAAGKFTKEDDLLLGAIEPDKKLMKKLLDTLTTYQFVYGVLAFENAEAQAEHPLAPYAERLKRDVTTLLGKLVEHGGEKHTMSERAKMRQTLGEWVSAMESFARETVERLKNMTDAAPKGLPPAVDLWAAF